MSQLKVLSLCPVLQVTSRLLVLNTSRTYTPPINVTSEGPSEGSLQALQPASGEMRRTIDSACSNCQLAGTACELINSRRGRYVPSTHAHGQS